MTFRSFAAGVLECHTIHRFHIPRSVLGLITGCAHMPVHPDFEGMGVPSSSAPSEPCPPSAGGGATHGWRAALARPCAAAPAPLRRMSVPALQDGPAAGVRAAGLAPRPSPRATQLPRPPAVANAPPTLAKRGSDEVLAGAPHKWCRVLGPDGDTTMVDEEETSERGATTFDRMDD